MGGGSPPVKRKGKWTEKFGPNSAVAVHREPGKYLYKLILEAWPPARVVWNRVTAVEWVGTAYCCGHLTHWFLLIQTSSMSKFPGQHDPEVTLHLCPRCAALVPSVEHHRAPFVASQSCHPSAMFTYWRAETSPLNVPLGFSCFSY